MGNKTAGPKKVINNNDFSYDQ
jgi:Ras-related protein Rab-5C